MKIEKIDSRDSSTHSLILVDCVVNRERERRRQTTGEASREKVNKMPSEKKQFQRGEKKIAFSFSFPVCCRANLLLCWLLASPHTQWYTTFDDLIKDNRILFSSIVEENEQFCVAARRKKEKKGADRKATKNFIFNKLLFLHTHTRYLPPDDDEKWWKVFPQETQQTMALRKLSFLSFQFAFFLCAAAVLSLKFLHIISFLFSFLWACKIAEILSRTDDDVE